MDAVTNLDGVKMIALTYCAKYDDDKKAEANKSNFIRQFLETYCVTTIPGIPADKKQNYPDRKRSPYNFINCCKFVKEYYDGIPDSDIVNCNAQFLLGIEGAV